MNISGLSKTTLLDYPQHLAATIFSANCNMRCPFCHNGNLVLNRDTLELINSQEIYDFLKNRQNILEGVCISGGEPTINKDLLDFMSRIKSYDLKIKLDTNGLKPEVIESAITHNLVDYIAMDIKNSQDKYAITCGLDKIDLQKIDQSIQLIMHSNIDYEFRTTVIRELHVKEDFNQIGQWLSGAKQYYLQQYRANNHQLTTNKYTNYTKSELTEFSEILAQYLEFVGIRGI